jgi:hypothetical protein
MLGAGLAAGTSPSLAKAAATSALPVEIGLVRFERVVGFFVGPIVGHSDRASCNVSINNQEVSMPLMSNPRHEAFAQALAQGMSASAAYVEAGYKANAGNACTLKSQQNISKRVVELQEEQLALHQQATVEAAANAKVTIESLIAEAEAARTKAMSEGRRSGCCERSDRQGQARWHVAREGRYAQHWSTRLRTYRADNRRASYEANRSGRTS